MAVFPSNSVLCSCNAFISDKYHEYGHIDFMSIQKMQTFIGRRNMHFIKKEKLDSTKQSL